MPSRQERRQAKRDAAKRAPRAEAAGAAGAAAALANPNVNVNPVGDWTTQAANPKVLFDALGGETVKQGLTLVPIFAQLELTLLLSAQLKLTLSPI
jgi:hypothetical protein